jgi:chemotaxis protein methyltransferase CheR
MKGLELSPQVFAILNALIEERTGIHYAVDDRELLAEKLAPRVVERGLDSLLDYYYFLRYDPGSELEFARLAEALVVNETYFFRELPALEVVVATFVPELVERGLRPRIWCAACATGEEPLTLAMLLDEAGLLDTVTLLGSDISERGLSHARKGKYYRRSLRALAPAAAERWFVPCEGGLQIVPRIAATVEWRRVNLVSPEEVARVGQFDVILCRNVLIYFSDPTVEEVVATLRRALHPGGRLIVGASESLLRFDSGLTCEERAGSFFYGKGSS